MKTRPIVRRSLGTALLVLGCTGAASADNFSNGSSAWSLLPPPPTSAWAQSLDRNQEIVRQTPTLSGRLEINKQTLLPYIGAGFGGGFVTERDRALGPSSVSPQQNPLGESLGKGAMPNEFQMGVRIPF